MRQYGGAMRERMGIRCCGALPDGRVSDWGSDSLVKAGGIMLGLGGLTRVFEEEIECLLGLDMAGDAAEGAVLLEFHVNGGDRLAHLAGGLLDLGIDFVAVGADGFALADFAEEHG